MSASAPIIGSMTERWVGVGRSAGTDSAAAGAEARATALDGRADARLLIVFASPAHDFAALLAGIAAGDVPLVGCSTAGEIATGGPGRPRRGRARARRCRLLGLHRGGDGRVGAAARGGRGGRALPGHARAAPHRTLLLLTDGLAGDQQEIVRGAYDVAGAAVPLVGGCAGDDLAMRETFLLHGDQVLRDAVVGVGARVATRRSASASSTAGAGSASPCSSPRSAGNRVYTLDDRPALDVYLERLGAPATDPAAFTRFALTHPLGLSRRSGEDHVRFVGGADFEDRSLGCIAAVPQGALAWFMEGDAESVLTATDDACAEALAVLEGATPLGVLAFDCIARRSVLGDGIACEVARIGDACGGAPVAGFYTYGEIARTRGISGFHNQTLVVLAVA